MVNSFMFCCLDISIFFFKDSFLGRGFLDQGPFPFPLDCKARWLSALWGFHQEAIVNRIKVCLDMGACVSNATFKILSGFDHFDSAVSLRFCFFLINLVFTVFPDYINQCSVSNLGDRWQLFLQTSFQALSSLRSDLWNCFSTLFFPFLTLSLTHRPFPVHILKGHALFTCKVLLFSLRLQCDPLFSCVSLRSAVCWDSVAVLWSASSMSLSFIHCTCLWRLSKVFDSTSNV